MSNLEYRIPDDMAVEVLSEAARLYAEASKGYSFTDLQQACSEAQIPPRIIKQAIRNVEEKRLKEQKKQQQLQEYIKQQVKKGIATGIAFLIPAVAISSILIFRSELKPVISKLLSPFKQADQQQQNTPFKTLTVKENKLEYLTDPRGLSIAITKTNTNESYLSTSTSVQGTIGTDGYKSLDIHYGQVGQFYDYKGIYNYRIKIIEIAGNSVTFQIEKLGQKPQSALQRLEQEVEQLQKQGKNFQSKTEKLQSKIEELQIENTDQNQRLKVRDQEIEKLEQENNRLKLQKSPN